MNTKQEKQIISINFDANVVSSIDDYVYITKKSLPVNKRGRVNRTTIVQMIIKEVLDDYVKNEKNSFLYKITLNKNS